MNFRTRFRLLLSAQILGLMITVMTAALVLAFTSYLAVPVLLLGVVVLQGYLLLRFFYASMTTLEHFVSALAYADFTQNFTSTNVDAELNSTFNEILERFRDARADKEAQASYLDTLVKHIPVPLMAVAADGSLTLLNHPMRQLLNIPSLSRFEQLTVAEVTLPEKLNRVAPGKSRLIQVRIHERPMELRVSVSEIRLGGKPERLYTLENFSDELSERENSAWRNLIRVMTHEIMNTLTPVTSLAHTADSLLASADVDADVKEAVTTIARRSTRLLEFVERYRELMKLPQPEFESVDVNKMLDEVVSLMRDALKDSHVEVDVDPPVLAIQADRVLIDQVLINLLTNAAEALEGRSDGQIQLRGFLEHGRVIIVIEDNGPGISDDLAPQMFIPFFTTKREGSGIGLALSRQIMRAHGAELAFNPRGDGASFSLIF